MGCGHSTLSCCKPPKKVKGAGGEVCLGRGGKCGTAPPQGTLGTAGSLCSAGACQEENCERPAPREVGKARPGGALSLAPG